MSNVVHTVIASWTVFARRGRSRKPARRSRDARNAAARTIAEVSCWGFMETARLDRQVLLFERGIENLINDPLQAAQLAADWALRDSEMIHAPGTTDWCSVCTGSEHTAIEMARQIMA